MAYARYKPYVYHSGSFPPGVKWLLIVNVAVFLVQFFGGVFAGRDPLRVWFGLAPRQVLGQAYLWQLVTYLFLHGGLMHILFNMFTLWMFGADLERGWGTRAFLRYYFLCGVGAGVCVLAANMAVGDLYTRTIGSSGAIYGLLMAYGLLYPDRTVLFSFLFPIKAKYFVMIIGAIAFLGSFGAAGSGVSHVAHLGGMLFGYVYLKARLPRRRLTGRSWMAAVRACYRDWKIRRARRKFEVYLRKHDRDRWVQ